MEKSPKNTGIPFSFQIVSLCICHKVFKNKNNNRIHLSLDLMVTSKQTISKRSFVKSLEFICPDRVVLKNLTTLQID